VLKELVIGFHHDDFTMIIGSAKGGVTLPNKNNSSVAFGGVAAPANWYEHTDNTADTYIFSRSTKEGGEDWRWGLKLTATEDGETLNAMDIQFRIAAGTPTVQLIGRLWDDSSTPNILDTLNFESSASTTYITGGDITTSFEWYTATATSPQTVSTGYVVGFEALNEGTSILTNYIVAARTDAVTPPPAKGNGWAGSTSQAFATSPYYMNQKLR